MARAFSRSLFQQLTGPEQWLKNVDRSAVEHAPGSRGSSRAGLSLVRLFAVRG